MAIKTQNGPRPDLAAVKVNPPMEYIGGTIYPVLVRNQTAGKIYYQPLTTDSAAQTGRSPGVAPTAVIIGSASVDYAAAEMLKRYGIDYSETPQYGDIANIDAVGGAGAKRSVMRAIENVQAAKLFTAGRYAAAGDIGAALMDGIADAAADVKRYAGKTAFVCSATVFRWLMRQTELTGMMSFSGAPGGVTLEAMMSKNPLAFKAMLQGIFAFDEVLVGDDDHWSITGMTDAAAVVKLPSTDDYGYKLQPELGRTCVYQPQGGDMFEINSFANDDIRANVYDAITMAQVIEFNAGAAKLVKGLAD